MRKSLVCFMLLALSGVSAMTAPVPIAQWTFENMTTGTVNALSPPSDPYIVTQAVDDSGVGNNLSLGAAHAGDYVTAPFQSSTVPTITTGYSGNGLSFDGAEPAGNEAIAINAWKSYATMTADFWYKSGDDQVGSNYLIGAPGVWEIYITNIARPHDNRLSFTTYCGSPLTAYTMFPVMNLGQNIWYHVLASIDVDGLKTLTVYAADNSTTPVYAGTQQVTIGEGLNLANRDIILGNKPTFTRHFNGVIDEVIITPEPATMVLLGLGGIILKSKRAKGKG